MKYYRTIWISLWGTAVAVGAALGFFLLPRPSLIALISVSALVAAATSALPHRTADTGGRTRTRTMRTAVRRAGIGAGTVLAAAGLGAFIDGFVWLLFLAAMLTSPRLIGILRSLRKAGQPRDLQPEQQSTAAGPDLQPAPELDDAELCRAWRTSYSAVKNAAAPGELERVYLCRRAYLNELEQRNPAAFRAWIKSGARASGDPARFLLNNHSSDGNAPT